MFLALWLTLKQDLGTKFSCQIFKSEVMLDWVLFCFINSWNDKKSNKFIVHEFNLISEIIVCNVAMQVRWMHFHFVPGD